MSLELYRKYRDDIDSLTTEEKLELIELCDFRVIKEDNYYRIEDLQGGNLGDIESEKFDDYIDILDRIGHYLYDIFISNGEAEYKLERKIYESISTVINKSVKKYRDNLINELNSYEDIYKVDPDTNEFKKILIKNLRGD